MCVPDRRAVDRYILPRSEIDEFLLAEKPGNSWELWVFSVQSGIFLPILFETVIFSEKTGFRFSDWYHFHLHGSRSYRVASPSIQDGISIARPRVYRIHLQTSGVRYDGSAWACRRVGHAEKTRGFYR